MEILLLVFLLSTLENNSDLSKKLRSALCFYRDNRDLIGMLARSANASAEQGGERAPEKEPERDRAQETSKKESRPEERVDSLKILDEYLRRTAT